MTIFKTVDENKVVKEEDTYEEKKKEIDKKQLEKAKEIEEEKEVEEEYMDEDKAYNKLLTAYSDFINNEMLDFHKLKYFFYNVADDVRRLDPHPYVSPFD